MHIRGECGFGDARVDAACGIGFTITTKAPAMVEVRPYLPFSWFYSNGAFTPFSHAESEGGVNLSAWLGSTCIAAGCVNSVRLFRDRVSPSELHQHTGDGSTSDLGIDFPLHPGDVVFVNLGAWVRCDSSTPVPTGATSSGLGRMEARAQFVVVKRFVLG